MAISPHSINIDNKWKKKTVKSIKAVKKGSLINSRNKSYGMRLPFQSAGPVFRVALLGVSDGEVRLQFDASGEIFQCFFTSVKENVQLRREKIMKRSIRKRRHSLLRFLIAMKRRRRSSLRPVSNVINSGKIRRGTEFIS